LSEGFTCESPNEAAAEISNKYNMTVSRLVTLKQPPEDDEEEAEARYLLLMAKPQKAMTDPESVGKRRDETLEDHTDGVVEHVRRIGEKLDLDKNLSDALTLAARWHYERDSNRDLSGHSTLMVVLQPQAEITGAIQLFG